MSTITDWISALSSFIGAISVIFLFLQVKWDYERSRRIKAYDVITSLTNNTSHAMTAAADIVERLNKQQINDLINGKEITVSKDLLKPIEKCLEDHNKNHNRENFLEKTANTVELTQDTVMDIRWHSREYLDSLETVLLSWRLGIASEDVIFEQMMPFHNGTDTMLREFRKLDDGDKKWPSIIEFEKALKTRKPNGNYKPFGFLPSR